MSAFLEMIKEAPPEDRKKAIEILLKDYQVVKKPIEPVKPSKWVSLKEFKKMLPVNKDKEWVRMFLLKRPEFAEWVINPNGGSGRSTRVNATKAKAWVDAHATNIDWNQRLPK